jgi:hypothetical protein
MRFLLSEYRLFSRYTRTCNIIWARKKSTIFRAPTFTNTQRHYVQISYIEFYRNLTINVANNDRNLVMPLCNVWLSLRRCLRHPQTPNKSFVDTSRTEFYKNVENTGKISSTPVSKVCLPLQWLSRNFYLLNGITCEYSTPNVPKSVNNCGQ